MLTKNLKSPLAAFTLVLISLLLAPTQALAQKSTIKIKLIKRAKVNAPIYETLSDAQNSVGIQMLGNNSIAPKKGFLLFEVQGSNSYLNIASNDKPTSWQGETEVKINENLFRIFFGDGGYLWSTCICPQTNDACSLTVTGADGGGLQWTCQGPECCTQKWGYIDSDGKGTVFE